MVFIDYGWDPRSVEAVAWALWQMLWCSCGTCRAEHILPHWSEPPWSEDVWAWSQAMAPEVQQLGWSMAIDGSHLLCPDCTRNQPIHDQSD